MKTDNVKKKRRSLYKALHVYLYSILYLLLLVNWTFIFSSQSDIVRINELSLWYWKYWYLWNHILKFTKTLDLKVLTYIITSLDIHYHKLYPIRLAAILVKMSVLTFITDVILYKQGTIMVVIVC